MTQADRSPLALAKALIAQFGSFAEVISAPPARLAESGLSEGVIDGPRVYFEDPDGNTLEIIDLTAYATILDEKHAH